MATVIYANIFSLKEIASQLYDDIHEIHQYPGWHEGCCTTHLFLCTNKLLQTRSRVCVCVCVSGCVCVLSHSPLTAGNRTEPRRPGTAVGHWKRGDREGERLCTHVLHIFNVYVFACCAPATFCITWFWIAFSTAWH